MMGPGNGRKAAAQSTGRGAGQPDSLVAFRAPHYSLRRGNGKAWMTTQRWLALGATACLTACSHQQMYKGSEHWRIQACEQRDPMVQEDCAAAAELDYQEYQRRRDQQVGH